MSEDIQRGRHGKSGHQNLIRMASYKLLNEILGDDYLSVTLVREQSLDIKATANIRGDRFGAMKILDADQRMYADIACAAVYDQDAKMREIGGWEIDEASADIANRLKEEGKLEEYRDFLKMAMGIMIYIIECETNPRSNLLREGPRLTSYKLLKQKNPNFQLFLAVFEDTKVDHPDIFDDVWRFPRRSSK